MLEMLKLSYKWWSNWRTLPVYAWIRAAVFYRAGDFRTAERLYREGLERHPTHPAHISARLDFAYCLFRNRKLSEAEEQLKSLCLESPYTREAYLRLARLQLWTGLTHEAASTMVKALRVFPIDAELASIFAIAAIDNGGPSDLIDEAEEALYSAPCDDSHSQLAQVARARMHAWRGQHEAGKRELMRLASQPRAIFEAVVALGILLLDEGRCMEARHQLSRALAVTPDHPHVLSLLALTYLRADAEHLNPDYAAQLATAACQHTGWNSSRELYILAESHLRRGDRMAALLSASRAQQVGRRDSHPRFAQDIDQLIEELASGSLS